MFEREESEYDVTQLTPEEHIDKVYKADYINLQNKLV